MEFIQRRGAAVTALLVFVVFSAVGTAIVAQEKQFGNGCEWDPDFFEVVCEDTPTPTPETPTATPITPTATPETPTATPVTPTKTPVTPTKTPVTPTNTPVTPTATPVTPTATPVTPTKTPVTPTATPVTPTATPVTPTATPVTPTATPVTPTATPVTPTATPVTPTATPVTPTATPVTPPPPPEAPFTQTTRAYRWVEVSWTANALYLTFELEVKDKNGDWQPVREVSSGAVDSGLRAIIDHAHRTADVRGFEFFWTKTLSIRVTGITKQNVKVTSDAFAVSRGARPRGRGHQHDHTVDYNLDGLGTTKLDEDLRDGTGLSAGKWNLLPRVQMCSGCPGANLDRAIVYSEIVRNPYACNGVACVVLERNIDDRLRDLTIKYERDPQEQDAGGLTAIWGKWHPDKSMHGKEDKGAQRKTFYFHIPTVALHELGHTLGLDDYYDNDSHHGIMKGILSLTVITQADKDLV